MALVENEFTARLRAYVRRRVDSSSDADDVVQTVLLRLLQSGQGPAPTSPDAWLLATARTVIADHFRARARSGEELPESAGIPEGDHEDLSDIGRCLAPLLAGLSSEDRSLLQRVDVAGESQAELAREMGVSPSGLKSRVQRARDRLRNAVLARCEFERDSRGTPVGPATCRPGTSRDPCGCNGESAADQGEGAACAP